LLEVLGPHALHELRSYGRWAAGEGGHPYEGIADGFGPGRRLYPVLTPEEAIAPARAQDPGTTLLLKPLIGGLAPEHAWSSLELLVGTVLPALADG
jgi:hypothetical protein